MYTKCVLLVSLGISCFVLWFGLLHKQAYFTHSLQLLTYANEFVHIKYLNHVNTFFTETLHFYKSALSVLMLKNEFSLIIDIYELYTYTYVLQGFLEGY